MKPNDSSSRNSTALDLLAARLEASRRAERWRDDPVLWVTEALGETVWSAQAAIMRAVAEHPRVLVRSCHGIGKSWIASRLVAWYLCTNPPGDYFVVVSAPRWDQIRSVIWRYLGQVHAEHELPGFLGQDCTWKINRELVAIGRKPSDHDEHGMQGYHARRGVVAIGDEGCSLPGSIWTGFDTLATTDASRILIIGNPDRTSSRFYQVATGAERGWHTIAVPASATPAFTGEAMIPGLVTQEWVRDKAQRWGVNSALYRIKVEAEFADGDESQVVPLEWVLRAQERWHALKADPDYEPTGPTVIGADIGHLGTDRTCIVVRKGEMVLSVEYWDKRTTIEVADLIEQRARQWVRPTVVPDGIGVGAGVVDLLRARGLNVRPFIASHATRRRDVTNTQGFLNVRAAAWWALREQLDPNMGARLALPDDDDLVSDITAPRFATIAGGRIQVEGKDAIRKRLKRSTDAADALVSTLFVEHLTREPRHDREPLHAIGYRRSYGEHWFGGSGALFDAAAFGYVPGQW